MSAGSIKLKAVSNFSAQGARPGQEDYLLCSDERGIFVVADGFGGPVSGANAAKAACEAVRSFLIKEAGDREATLPFVLRSYFSLAGNVLFNALIHANRKVVFGNKGKDVHERGGASLIAGFIDGDLLALANAGGCSCWLFRDGRATELVMPRTYGKLCDPLSVEHPVELRIPLMAVGTAEDLEPEIFEYRLKAGDWLLFQTDGISRRAREQLLEVYKKNMSHVIFSDFLIPWTAQFLTI